MTDKNTSAGPTKAKPRRGPTSEFRIFGTRHKLAVERGAHDGSFPDFPAWQTPKPGGS